MIARASRAAAPVRLAGLSVVVPAYNEAASIAGVARALLAVLPEVAACAEVIVVDDGSVDGTAAEAARVPGVRVVRHPTNRGYGAALRTGFASAREPWTFFTDGDGQFDVRELGRLVAASGDADLVAGYRAARADPLPRRLAGRAWTRLVRLLLGVPAVDVNCAFKLVRREVLDAIELEAEGALINAELLGKAVRRGFRVRQVPVSHRPRRHGRATGGSPRVVARALRELVALAGPIRAAATTLPARGVKRARAAAMVGVLAALWPVMAGAADVGRYHFSCRSDAGTFVLDTVSGRVWRYDRVDDAWYLYDLEALVGKSARGRRAEPSETPPGDAEPER